jgi:iron complex outermembrane receptor protein
MKSIPFSAIERVEVLRDGASAQYGSDAIGVVNIILKKQTNYTEVSLTSGVTSKEMVSILVLILTRGLKSLIKVL